MNLLNLGMDSISTTPLFHWMVLPVRFEIWTQLHAQSLVRQLAKLPLCSLCSTFPPVSSFAAAAQDGLEVKSQDATLPQTECEI